jgi:hypothetical protein
LYILLQGYNQIYLLKGDIKMPVKLSKADMAKFANNPRLFLSDHKNAAKLAGINRADKNRLAGEIANLKNINKADVLRKLDNLAIVSVSAIDW